MDTKLKLTFCGGAGAVTGSNFLLEGNGKKFLIDCGLEQGSKSAEDSNWKPFKYDPKEIDILFITHSHIDHIGLIPKLISEGFNGRIISTIPSREIAEIMLTDTNHILSRDTEHNLNKIYTTDNLKKAMGLWEGVEYHQDVNVDCGFRFSFKDAGHILGSGMLEVVYNEKKIVFTGDLGNSPSPILPDTEDITDADYLIMESVYGDRNHDGVDLRKDKLEEVIRNNYNKKGVLMIPSFSLERTQELLFELNDLVENKDIRRVPIFLDSPLSIRLTRVYKRLSKYFNKNSRHLIESGDDIFNFPGLRMTEQTQESIDILQVNSPKIIIAGSGMSNGGRIIHHEKNYLSNPKNTLLLIGYQAAGTPGRFIQEGNKKLHVLGEEVYIKAEIKNITGYSGHKSSDELIKFVKNTSKTLKKVFVVMGEPKSSMFLAQKLRDILGVKAFTPEDGESLFLEV
ncbi:MAG: MBL fold metallo-hydrolase [Patescibacteria group bacterium]|nr:MBL fold metallo-hydrolase [Patescibacteria group bacterium]